MWTCPNCGAENPFSTPVCGKCDEIRAIVGGGGNSLTKVIEKDQKEDDDG